MLLENSFAVSADPDVVFRFLQDPANIAACLPGAELVEDLGRNSYRARIRVKIGPVLASYGGIATITKRDPVERITVLLAEGRDAAGNGAAKATSTMQVYGNDRGNGSTVELRTELTVSGRLAQFGPRIMSDVASRTVGEMAGRVRDMIDADLEAVAAVAANNHAPKASGGLFRRMFGGNPGSRHGA
jgi:hypothetical protein